MPSGIDRSYSDAVVAAIARHRDVDSEALTFVLAEQIDAGALDALGRHAGSDWRLSTMIDGHAVTVDGYGCVTVDGTRYEPLT